VKSTHPRADVTQAHFLVDAYSFNFLHTHLHLSESITANAYQNKNASGRVKEEHLNSYVERVVLCIKSTVDVSANLTFA
jgi:hypothetical protein